MRLFFLNWFQMLCVRHISSNSAFYPHFRVLSSIPRFILNSAFIPNSGSVFRFRIPVPYSGSVFWFCVLSLTRHSRHVGVPRRKNFDEMLLSCTPIWPPSSLLSCSPGTECKRSILNLKLKLHIAYTG